MVKSNKYYKSRAAGVTSEVSLTTDRDLYVPPCLRNSTSFMPLRYQKSRGTSLYTTDGTLTGATTPGWSRPGSNGNEEVFQHYWNLTIRLFCVISETLVGGFLLLCRETISVFNSPGRSNKQSLVCFGFMAHQPL